MRNYLGKTVLLLLALFVFLYTSFSQSLIINEFQAKNQNTIRDNYDEADDWIEIMNTTSASINLNGYFITDDAANPPKCVLYSAANELVIPSHGFMILWADKQVEQGSKHLNFKLDAEGEFIGLYSPAVEFIDSVRFMAQQTDISMGRDISDTLLWKYYTNPTPGAANNTASFGGVVDDPVFTVKSGSFTSPFYLNIKCTNCDSIFYTLDASTPNETSMLYTDSLYIDRPIVVRARGFRLGWITSNISSQIYLENSSPKLPVIAMITDSLNLWGNTGIYSNPEEKGEDWERSCQIKYFDGGKLVTEKDAGVRIQGSSSVVMPKKAFRLFFRDSDFDYPVFGDINIKSFSKLVLKPGYDDDITTSTGTLLRDALSAALWKSLGGLENHSSWAVLYINNKYWGIYNIRESVDEHYIIAHTQLADFDMVRFINANAELKYGTMDRWNGFYDYVKSTDFSIPKNYQDVQSMINMNDFINLLAFVQASEYYSWCWGISMYAENVQGGLWKLSIWDTDRAYTNENWNGLTEAQSKGYWANIFPRRFMENSSFSHEYINRICDLFNSTFIPDSAIYVFDSLYNIIKPEMPAELSRWKPDNTTWENNVEHIRDFLRKRPGIVYNQIKNYYDLTGTHQVTLNVTGMGSIRINSLKIDKFPWVGTYFEDNEIEIEAVPDAGYHFAGWNDNFTDNISKKWVNVTSNTTFNAVFEPGASSTDQVLFSSVLKVYPNPCNDRTIVEFWLEKPASVEIALISSEGKLIGHKVKGYFLEGHHSAPFSKLCPGEVTLPPSVYFISFTTDEMTIYKKVIKLK